MDWFSWLSKTGLDPSLVSEYAIAFTHNELEEDDVVYFNHEFLKSMGISKAKHRLEILKLARKEKEGSSRPMLRLTVAIKRVKMNLFKYIRKWVVPKRCYRLGWKKNMIKRNNSLAMKKQEILLLTNESPMVERSPWPNRFSSPTVRLRNGKKTNEISDWYWSTGIEEVRWDTMFQELKPI